MKGSKVKSTKGGFSVTSGGKGMVGFTGAAPAKPGGVSVSDSKGNKSFAPDTGGKAMAGYTGVTPAKAK